MPDHVIAATDRTLWLPDGPVWASDGSIWTSDRLIWNDLLTAANANGCRANREGVKC